MTCTASRLGAVRGMPIPKAKRAVWGEPGLSTMTTRVLDGAGAGGRETSLLAAVVGLGVIVQAPKYCSARRRASFSLMSPEKMRAESWGAYRCDQKASI